MLQQTKKNTPTTDIENTIMITTKTVLSHEFDYTIHYKTSDHVYCKTTVSRI